MLLNLNIKDKPQDPCFHLFCQLLMLLLCSLLLLGFVGCLAFVDGCLCSCLVNCALVCIGIFKNLRF